MPPFVIVRQPRPGLRASLLVVLLGPNLLAFGQRVEHRLCLAAYGLHHFRLARPDHLGPAWRCDSCAGDSVDTP